MTVGGSTTGRATSVSIAGAIRQRVVLSQCASGTPRAPSTSVVIAASRSVSHSDCHKGAERPRKLEAESDKTVRSLKAERGTANIEHSTLNLQYVTRVAA